MKIFLAPPTDIAEDEPAFLEKWQDTVRAIPENGEKYTLVSDASLADHAIISSSHDLDNDRLIDILRPLTRRDIQTFTWDFSDRPTGRFSGFYCSLPARLFDARRHSALSYPVIFNEMIEAFPRHDATLDFSFLGALTAGVRVRLVEQFGDGRLAHNAVVRASQKRDSVFSDANRARGAVRPERAEYAALLRRSKFVLCPRGFGTGTFRLFETMQAGRVPVIISDGYVKPAGIDWEGCSLTIPERRIADVPGIIAGRMDDWEQLAANARAAWETNFSPRHVMDRIATDLSRMSREISAGRFSPLHYSMRAGVEKLRGQVRPLAGRARQMLAPAGVKTAAAPSHRFP